MDIFNDKDKEAMIVNGAFNRLMEKIENDVVNIELYRKIFDAGFTACITVAIYKTENNNELSK